MNKKNFGSDADTLMKIGFSRVVSKTLVCLSDGKEKTSHEIEMETGLRQPEVSKAMTALQKYISCGERKNNYMKGRPVKHFKLCVSFQTIISEKAIEIESEMKKMLETAESMMAENK